jgi:hypothetical protein
VRTIDMLLHHHPVDHGFRLTGGLMVNGNRIDAAGPPNANGSCVGTLKLPSDVGVISEPSV